VTSSSTDGRKRVVFVDSDTNPGDFYLFDQASGSLSKLVSSMSWIKPAQMASMEPIELSARDGLKLRGYLTRPLGKEAAKQLPMVVLVHGGPYGVRDNWAFDPEVQLLASRGYAVLQVNFRGSDGYGHAFARAGFGEWGGKMQDDVTDATRWAITQGIADAKRICIYGASYGGYAALEGAVKEPDLYQCAIGNSGVYDLRLMHSRGDIHESEHGEAYLMDALGNFTPRPLARARHADRRRCRPARAARARQEPAQRPRRPQDRA
jgi:dipeptidyl aminopeptidase/acylaminoacyl peptidase